MVTRDEFGSGVSLLRKTGELGDMFEEQMFPRHG